MSQTTTDYSKLFHKKNSHQQGQIYSSNTLNCFSNSVIYGRKYETLLNWIMEMLDDIGTHNSTKYLAKIYVDLYLASGVRIPVNRLQLLGMSAIILAIKFNESKRFEIKDSFQVFNLDYTVQEILEFQNTLLKFLKFKLYYQTPYCIVNASKTENPTIDQSIFENLQDLIAYCSTFSELANLSAHQIYFGSFLYLCKVQQNDFLQNKILEVSKNLIGVKEISEFIEQKFNQENQFKNSFQTQSTIS